MEKLKDEIVELPKKEDGENKQNQEEKKDKEQQQDTQQKESQEVKQVLNEWIDNINELYKLTVYILQRLEAKFHQSSINCIRNMWIMKLGGLSRGRGIKVYKSLGKITSFFSNKENPWIIMQYIENPLIIKTQGAVRKFDIRQWVLVTDWEPLIIWFFEECYHRFTTEDYEKNNVTFYLSFRRNFIEWKTLKEQFKQGQRRKIFEVLLNLEIQ